MGAGGVKGEQLPFNDGWYFNASLWIQMGLLVLLLIGVPTLIMYLAVSFG